MYAGHVLNMCWTMFNNGWHMFDYVQVRHMFQHMFLTLPSHPCAAFTFLSPLCSCANTDRNWQCVHVHICMWAHSVTLLHVSLYPIFPQYPWVYPRVPAAIPILYPRPAWQVVWVFITITISFISTPILHPLPHHPPSPLPPIVEMIKKGGMMREWRGGDEERGEEWKWE